MPGTVDADIRECPRVLILSRLDSINLVVREPLPVILVRKVGLQAVDLVKKYIRNWVLGKWIGGCTIASTPLKFRM